ncbi:hypothetical protein MLD38_025805 [Melastoma candidum]|uniref:Uncharacterized protein n=1 Tax=Melastoma candidum TaxID=119954 RepID=A0ACB9P3F5_9MYRT|nr:hypothetical protein MLD38_025805 [Melastoma candidum]
MADKDHFSRGTPSTTPTATTTTNATTSVDFADNGDQDMKPEFSEDEETLIIRMYNLVGRRWRLIAGRIPGRTAEEIQKFWTRRHPVGSIG